MGLLATAGQLLISNIPLVAIVATLVYLLRNYFYHGLHIYPGPFLARLTNLWRFVDVYNRRPELTHLALHAKHGDIVRLGPNVLSFAEPKAIKDIYGLNKGYVKSAFYPVQQAASSGRPLPSLFGTTDEAYHAQLRRSVNSAFSMSAIVQYEPSVDRITSLFLRRTQELFIHHGPGRVCDFTHWLQFFAFDAIGMITYSTPHGFLERNEDVDGVVAFLRRMFDYVSPVGQMPWLDKWLLKNPLLKITEKLGYGSATFPVVTFAKARMAERMREIEATQKHGDLEKHGVAQDRPDLLGKFLKAQEERPEFFDDRKVLVMATSMATAGSETTAITLAAIFYYLLKNPSAYDKLMQELKDAATNGTILQRKNGLVSWSEAQGLSYFDAVVKEAFRLHPATGLLLERVTPQQGAQVAGRHIPGGTIVGVNAWVAHRRPEIFGPDVDAFRPERWLEASPAQRKEMEGGLLHFGAGARTCIGKNISLLEIYKMVPSFLLRFRVSLADPSKEWTPHNAWFVRQKDFYVRFEVRDEKQL